MNLGVTTHVKHLQDLKYQVMEGGSWGDRGEITANKMPKIMIRQSRVLFGTKNMLPQLAPDKFSTRC